jgi:hypothetical protein
MAKRPSTADEIYKIFDEVTFQNDRTAAIILGSYVEFALQDAIEGKWPPISNTLRDDIFEGNGPLATFSAKIDIGLAMGLFGLQTKTDLNSIRWIRNKFAHELGQLTFETDFIANRVALIKSARTPPDELLGGISKQRFIFINASVVISTNLLITHPRNSETGYIPLLP